LDAEGRPYYNHPQVAESTYENPIDTYHKALFLQYAGVPPDSPDVGAAAAASPRRPQV
jgi:hypothetical protein